MRFCRQEKTITIEEDDLEEYEMFYGLRLLKSQKQYTQHKKYMEKQKRFVEQKETEQAELITEFFEEFADKIVLKNRISEKDNKTIKKKYYRQPKIYQNDYIVELQNLRKITEYFSINDD